LVFSINQSIKFYFTEITGACLKSVLEHCAALSLLCSSGGSTVLNKGLNACCLLLVIIAIITLLGFVYLRVVEVARTRMREEGSRYHGFWQTLMKVASDEGVRGVYRGLTTQLIKHIPNTAIMMSTYEAVVYLCRRHGL